MKITQAEIERACSSENPNLALEYVMIDRDNSAIVATDGIILVCTPIEFSDQDTLTGVKLITPDSYKRIRALLYATDGEVIATDDCIQAIGGEIIAALTTAKIPDLAKMLGLIANFPYSFAIDANQLRRAAMALSEPLEQITDPIMADDEQYTNDDRPLFVRVYLRDDKSPIIIRPLNSHVEDFGIVMPCHNADKQDNGTAALPAWKVSK